MVIDLAKCKNARKCVEACQEGHMLPKDHEWIKLYLLQDDKNTAKYWFPVHVSIAINQCALASVRLVPRIKGMMELYLWTTRDVSGANSV
jgi:Fe-S-cluster-containing dehydrogenase component